MALKDKNDRSKYNREYYALHREKIIASHKKYREDYKEILIERRRKHYAENKNKADSKYKKSHAARFGLSLEEYNKIIDKGCEICGLRFGKLCVDHNHVTNKIRGCLCSQCNSAIGLMKEDIDALLSAIKYLKIHSGEIEQK
jgi:hypothetical protein